MATWNGSELGDYIELQDEVNEVNADGGDDLIVASSGVNTIYYNAGDGIDTIQFAAPRTYQFAGFLAAAQMALDGGLGTGSYSNSYFSNVDSGLLERLPPSIRDVLAGLQYGGTVAAGTAETAFHALIDWINAPVSNVVVFGPGISLSSLTVQPGAPTSFGVPGVSSVTLGPDAGLVFQMLPPDLIAPMPDGYELPPEPAMDIQFQFDDGSTATLSQVMEQTDDGVAGFQYGSEDADLLEGSLASDQIYGNGGDDQVDARAGSDSIYGGEGADVLAGGAGFDIIYGDGGDDVIAAGLDGGSVGGGGGNDTYLFNLGDGTLFVDNTPGVDEGEVDTLSFGGGILTGNVAAYVDESGTLSLVVQGSADQVMINWFYYDGSGFVTRTDQVVARAQFVNEDGSVQVFDLQGLVDANRNALLNATPDAPVYLFGTSAAAAFDVTDEPGAVAGGEYAVRYADTGSVFEVQAPAANLAPVAGTLDDVSVDEGAFSFTIPASTFSDPEGKALTYFAQLEVDGVLTTLPSWLTFTGVALTFAGTADDAQVGTYTIRVTAQDDHHEAASTTFDLTVANVNEAPTVENAVGTVTTDEDVPLTIDLSHVFQDADADQLELGFTGLPSWLTYDAQAQTLSGTPGNDDVSNYSITATATDSAGEFVSHDFTVSVVNVNDAPTVTSEIGALEVDEDAPVVISLAGLFQDVDSGDNLALTFDGLPSWLSYDGEALVGTPGNADVGTSSITITATDGSGDHVDQTFSLSVENQNDAPTVASEIGALDVNEDAQVVISMDGLFQDVDAGDSLELSFGGLPAWLHYDADANALVGTPGNAEVGSYSVTVTATDESAAFASQTFGVTVHNQNDAPVVANDIGNVVSDEDVTITIDLADAFADVDGDSLSLSFDALPSWLVYDAQAGILSGTPGDAQVGSYTITATASDGGNDGTASQTFSVVVQNVNEAPTVVGSLEDQTVDEDTAVAIDVSGLFSDPDLDDNLTVAVSGASWLTLDNGMLSGTPGDADVGTSTVTLTATDAAGESVTYSFDLTVDNTNDDPTRNLTMPAQQVAEDTVATIALPAGMFSDVDADSGDSLTLSARLANGDPLPAWISFDAAAGTFTVAPGNDQVGTLSIEVTAKDKAGATASGNFALTVTNVNDAPVLAAPIADQSAMQDSPFSFTLPAGTFTDVDNASLTLSATLEGGAALPAWLTFNPATRTFSGTPGNVNVGSLSVRVTASDGSLSVSDVFNLTVADSNDAPELVQPLADLAATAGQAFSAVLPADAFRDIDGDPLTYSVTLADGSALPSWLTFNAATLTLSGTAPDIAAGARTASALDLRVVASDGRGGWASDVFALSINGTQVEQGQTIVGGRGDDRITGGAGNDDLTGGRGRDVLNGGAGDDTLHLSRDATWAGNARRTNVGSPGYDGSNESVNLSGKRQSEDVFIGGDGVDTLLGTGRSDVVLLDDTRSRALQSGPRLSGIEIIDVGAGDDVVDLTSRRYSYGDVTVRGGDGDDVLWTSSGNDNLYGDAGRDRMDGGAGKDYLSGGSGDDALYGGYMEDVLQGGSGSDHLKDISPTASSLLDGGSGNDTLEDRSGKSLFIGGRGDDTLRLGGGDDIIAFNRGDGRDTVISGNGGKVSLSLGGAIRIDELAFRKSGNDLILEIGRNESITFDDWYRGRQYQSVTTLQFITEDMSGGPARARDDNVEWFNFQNLVSAFDTARRNPGLSRWALTNGMTNFMVGSDTQAIGGDLAYQYGTTGSLAGIALSAAQEQISASGFGGKQTLHTLDSLTEGVIKLS